MVKHTGVDAIDNFHVVLHVQVTVKYRYLKMPRHMSK